MPGHPSEADPRHDPVSEIASHLRDRSKRVTGARRAILRVLRDEQRPMTMKEILQAMHGVPCNLVTVYRSIQLLEEMEFVKRFDFGDGVARYELIGGQGLGHHHHHLVCNKCARVVELEDCFPEELERSIARRNGFKGVTHRLEFFGTCPACQQ
jgi:Fur family ferric uptake transcriptional regulator